MKMRDQIQLVNWLRSGASLAEVESVSPIGLVGNVRFSPAAVRAYKLIWAWSAPRFHGEAGSAQERFYTKRGAAATMRRIDRCRSIVDNLLGRSQSREVRTYQVYQRMHGLVRPAYRIDIAADNAKNFSEQCPRGIYWIDGLDQSFGIKPVVQKGACK